MLCTEIFPICSETYTQHTNVLCGQNVDFFFNFKPCGTQSNHLIVKVKESSYPYLRCSHIVVPSYFCQGLTIQVACSLQHNTHYEYMVTVSVAVTK